MLPIPEASSLYLIPNDISKKQHGFQEDPKKGNK